MNYIFQSRLCYQSALVFLLEGEREAIEGFAVQNNEEVNRELCGLVFCGAKTKEESVSELDEFGFAVQNEEAVNRELCELNELGFCGAKRRRQISPQIKQITQIWFCGAKRGKKFVIELCELCEFGFAV